MYQNMPFEKGNQLAAGKGKHGPLRQDATIELITRSSGGMSLMCRECAEISSRVYDRKTRLVEGGRFATESPGRHSAAHRTGRADFPQEIALHKF
jgi:hypothetical protein